MNFFSVSGKFLPYFNTFPTLKVATLRGHELEISTENTESDESWIIVDNFRLRTSDEGTVVIIHREKVHSHVTRSLFEL